MVVLLIYIKKCVRTQPKSAVFCVRTQFGKKGEKSLQKGGREEGDLGTESPSTVGEERYTLYITCVRHKNSRYFNDRMVLPQAVFRKTKKTRKNQKKQGVFSKKGHSKKMMFFEVFFGFLRFFQRPLAVKPLQK